MKTVTIIRGVSGSGKSSFAEYLQSNCSAKICTADDYFCKDGEFKFDVNKLKDAHAYCRDKFAMYIHSGVEHIVVANTNTAEKEFVFYKEEAEKQGYKVFVVVMENRHNGTNVHGCPEETIKKQEQRLRSSLKFI